MTQQELAEAIGVSHSWYAALESAGTRRISIGLADRLADALMTAPEERARLFLLAVPELAGRQFRDAIAVLESFSGLRSFIRRLMSATSDEDILAITSEHIASWADSPLLVLTSRRRESGLWEYQTVDDKHARSTASKLIKDAWHLLSEEADALNLYPRLVHAGEVGTQELYPLPLQRAFLKLFARGGCAGYTFLKGRVRSRTGLIAGVSIWHELGHFYSASDRAILGAFAEVASLALS